LAEFDLRYNHRIRFGFNDGERAALAVKNSTGKRLTYQQPHQGKFQIRCGAVHALAKETLEASQAEACPLLAVAEACPLPEFIARATMASAANAKTNASRSSDLESAM